MSCIYSDYRYQHTSDVIPPNAPSQEVGHWSAIILHTALYLSLRLWMFHLKSLFARCLRICPMRLLSATTGGYEHHGILKLHIYQWFLPNIGDEYIRLIAIILGLSL